MQKFKTADDYFHRASPWQSEIQALRTHLLTSKLTEDIKWGAPCYTYLGKNVVGLGAYKSYFGLWFHQGALLADKNKVLINAQDGKTKALRQWRMTSLDDIHPKLITSYVNEAINLVKAGKSVGPNRGKPVIIPDELAKALTFDKGAKIAFETLTLGLRREYADYISSAKQEATKLRRLDKILPMILNGEGLNDKYR